MKADTYAAENMYDAWDNGDRHEIRKRFARRDELIRMAREAGIGWWLDDGKLEQFAALVAAAEREACAKVCDGMVDAEYKTGKVDHNEMGWTQACAIAIRARSKT